METDLYMNSLSSAFKITLVLGNDQTQDQKMDKRNDLTSSIKEMELEQISKPEFLLEILKTFFGFESFINEQLKTI